MSKRERVYTDNRVMPTAGEEEADSETPASIAGRMKHEDARFQLAMNAAGYRQMPPRAGGSDSVLQTFHSYTHIETNSTLADC